MCHARRGQERRLGRGRLNDNAAVRRLIALGTVVASIAVTPAAAAGGPKVALDATVEATAKHATIEPADLPAGWRVDAAWKRASAITDQGGIFDCRGHRADLSALVVRGAWSSRNQWVKGNAAQQVTTGVTLLATPAQAAAELAVAVRFYPRYCSLAGTSSNGSRTESVDRLRVPKVGAARAGFRSVLTVRGAPFRRLVGDIVFVRNGRAFVAMLFVRTEKAFDPSLETELLRKVVARTRD